MSRRIKFESLTPAQLKTVLGEYNNHMKYIQERLDIKIMQRQGDFCLSGDVTNVERGERIIYKMVDEAQNTKDISAEELHLIIQSSLSRDEDIEEDEQDHDDMEYDEDLDEASEFTPISLRTRKGRIVPRGGNQQRYVKNVLSSDVSFGIGPAGTGKTYLAVACAVDMLERNEIERILLVRPAVEAGEKLGFLPGDLTQKIDPYLRPLYDALYEMIGFEKVGKMIERQIIEVAPLAYMRGRTLNNSFVILDEAQNTTPEQMKMFLTRLGFGSRAVITGDITQVDLPRGHKSGLAQAMDILKDIEEIHITKFDSKDVVRHQLVQQIVEAYDVFDEEQMALEEKRKFERIKEQERRQAVANAAANL
ncbi:PhoH family protein [Psychrobacter sp. 4Dc]|nr:ATP-binding protein [Psychrobacter sp. P11G3]NYR09348.1 PhoH family protein [Psychrobacter sp. BI730]OEH68437.1 MAG: ATP-binding protein [Psychrobacter sp. B29-1]PKG67182.1 PhoH family protein [Psychrobacter sp. Choline-02u-13]PKH48476.1 PhoH family protein [Psychrobacter sp. Choline-02u-9]PKH65612.1 PhoH family protein [Psychrobacter sp. 4Dc]PLT22701.1 PhoH family protein [Psychrobacter sp. MES7-P7E]TEW87190.1 PhoH family protein [Psychrobacter sp. 230]|tara:strand:- start:25366 stop:26457 length:1092 start_codon:yes stop_codon:yes gene_type:complete